MRLFHTSIHKCTHMDANVSNCGTKTNNLLKSRTKYMRIHAGLGKTRLIEIVNHNRLFLFAETKLKAIQLSQDCMLYAHYEHHNFEIAFKIIWIVPVILYSRSFYQSTFLILVVFFFYQHLFSCKWLAQSLLFPIKSEILLYFHQWIIWSQNGTEYGKSMYSKGKFYRCSFTSPSLLIEINIKRSCVFGHFQFLCIVWSIFFSESILQMDVHIFRNCSVFFFRLNQSNNLMFNPVLRLFIDSFKTNIRIWIKSH